MPKYGSLSAALKDSSAARSDGVQDITAEVTENITVTTNRKEAIVARSFLSEWICEEDNAYFYVFYTYLMTKLPRLHSVSL